MSCALLRAALCFSLYTNRAELRHRCSMTQNSLLHNTIWPRGSFPSEGRGMNSKL